LRLNSRNGLTSVAFLAFVGIAEEIGTQVVSNSPSSMRFGPVKDAAENDQRENQRVATNVATPIAIRIFLKLLLTNVIPSKTVFNESLPRKTAALLAEDCVRHHV
jgi:hypothetical protein